jgi:S-adenosylmethionine:tRNA ribosyltransferase-isomerase
MNRPLPEPSAEYRVEDFDYTLPRERIAQNPTPRREDAKIWVNAGAGQDRVIPFHRFPELLDRRDVLVVNTSRVIKARFDAVNLRSGRCHELLFVRELETGFWEVMIHNTRRLRPGDRLQIGEGYVASLVEKGRVNTVRIDPPGGVVEITERFGRVPLPPYIQRPSRTPRPEDRERYQTVYARESGSSAAPTAGLHFTPAILDALRERGVDIVPVVLHVGPGTFLPVKASRLAEHRMHSEWIEMNADTATLLNRARREKRRVNAVGTTSLRVLESCFRNGRFVPRRGTTDLFIHPPKKVLSTDRLLTNFHLPRSTLFMLVCAFSTIDRVKHIYADAIRNKMRFYSYGDAVFLQNASGGM